MESNTRVAGNFIVNGNFDVPDPTGNQGQVVGRLLTLDNDLVLQGNSIVNPEDYVCSK
jgi:hypothetical protein